MTISIRTVQVYIRTGESFERSHLAVCNNDPECPEINNFPFEEHAEPGVVLPGRRDDGGEKTQKLILREYEVRVEKLKNSLKRNGKTGRAMLMFEIRRPLTIVG